MAESSNYSEDGLPDDCGYNCIYKHQWRTPTNALPMSAVDKIHSIVNKRWGWYFQPHKNMDYSRQDWFKDQTLIITFESKMDLVLAKLLVTINK